MATSRTKVDRKEDGVARKEREVEYGAREYVSAYNLVSHSRVQALGQVAIDGTAAPAGSGPFRCRIASQKTDHSAGTKTSASQTPASRPLHPSLSAS